MKKTNTNGFELEYKQGTKWNDTSKSWYMQCKVCNEMTKVGSDELSSVTCSICVSSGLKEFEDNARS